MPKIGVAVIGCGFIAPAHLKAWRRIREAELVAVVDIIEGRAKWAASEFKVPLYFTDYTRVLDLEEVDVIDICTPTYTHAEIAVAAAKSGKHVLVEKPIALRLREADEMIRAARRANVKLMVAHCLRFWPEYVAAKKIISKGEIGEPRIARAYRLSEFPHWAPWHKDLRLGGGVFVDMSIHDIDFLRWIMGEVEEVYARGGILKFRDSTAYDYVHALLKFKTGAIAYVEGSWIQPPGYPFTTYLEVVGTRGTLRVDNRSSAALQVYKPSGTSYYTPVSEDPYYLEIKHFASCVLRDEEPCVSGEEARRSLEVALAAIKSMMRRGPVRLPLKGEVL